MVIGSQLDPWEEIRSGRADEAGADIYWLSIGTRKGDLKVVASTLKAIIKHKEWRKWRWIGQDFECSSLRDCLLRHPPNGAGVDLGILRRIILDDKEALDMLDKALQNPAHLRLSDDVDIVNITRRPDGNSPEYVLRRLRADDRPLAKELHTKVLTGEMSPHRAGVLAGYRKEPTPLEQIHRLWTKLNANDRKSHLEWTLTQCATCGRPGTWEGSAPVGSWCDACCEEGMKDLP